MLTDQTRAPIVEALAEFKAQGAISFGVPGHKSGKAAPEDIKQLLGAKVFETDATTQKGIDDRTRDQGGPAAGGAPRRRGLGRGVQLPVHQRVEPQQPRRLS